MRSAGPCPLLRLDADAQLAHRGVQRARHRGRGRAGGDDVPEPVVRVFGGPYGGTRRGGDGDGRDTVDGARGVDALDAAQRPRAPGEQEPDAACAECEGVRSSGIPVATRSCCSSRSMPVACRTASGIMPPASRGLTSITATPLPVSLTSVWVGPSSQPMALRAALTVSATAPATGPVRGRGTGARSPRSAGLP